MVIIFMKILGFFQQHKFHLGVPLSPSDTSLKPVTHEDDNHMFWNIRFPGLTYSFIEIFCSSSLSGWYLPLRNKAHSFVRELI